jgi:hypothetical protein
MVPTKRLKANELVVMLAGLLKLEVALLTRVANVPKRNLVSWLAGKKSNLRLQSVTSLLTLLGLKIEEGIKLDDKRVHFWHVNDGLFAGGKAAYDSISKLSKLMTGCMITRVTPANKRLLSGRDYFLISGTGVRVVVIVKKGVFRSAKVNPEVVKGACWRDDNEHHTITVNNSLWAHLVEKDLTLHEFDRIFQQVEETVSWLDLSLIAREFGVVPQQLSDWIMETFGEASAPVSNDRGIDIDGGGRLLAIAHSRKVA